MSFDFVQTYFYNRRPICLTLVLSILSPSAYILQMPSKTGHTMYGAVVTLMVQNNSICTDMRWAWSLTSPRWRPAAVCQIILTHTFPGKLGGPESRAQLTPIQTMQCRNNCIKVLRCRCQKMQWRTQLLYLLLLFY